VIIALSLCTMVLGVVVVRWGVSVISRRPTAGSDARILAGAAMFAAGGVGAAVGVVARLLALFAVYTVILSPSVIELFVFD